MKQASFQGFGAKGAVYATPVILPVNMPDEVVTLCKDSIAAAVTHSMNFARARFGYSQMDVAKRCGWDSASFLSEIARGRKAMPESRVENFVLATGCNLLGQVIHRKRIEERIAGRETENERNKAVLAAMLRAAA